MEFIDFIFSSIYPVLIIWFIIIGLGILVFKLWDTVNHEKLRGFIAIFLPFIVFFVLFFIWILGYYGNVKDIKSFTIVDNKLCFIDYNLRKIKRMGNDYNISRLYVVDKNSGEKIDRKWIGHDAKIIEIEDRNIIFRTKSGKLSLYNIENKTITNDIPKIKEYSNNYKLENKQGFSFIKKNNELKYYDSLTNSKFSILLENEELINSKISNSIKYKDHLFFNIENIIFCLNLVDRKILWQKKY